MKSLRGLSRGRANTHVFFPEWFFSPLFGAIFFSPFFIHVGATRPSFSSPPYFLRLSWEFYIFSRK
jgi:hypothetical protein